MRFTLPPPIYQAQQINHHKYKSRASKREEASVERRGTHRRPKELHGLWPAKRTYKVKGFSISKQRLYFFMYNLECSFNDMSSGILHKISAKNRNKQEKCRLQNRETWKETWKAYNFIFIQLGRGFLD